MRDIRRYPMADPSPDRWLVIEQLFNEAVDLAPSARETLLAELCGGDKELFSQVMDLLVADEEAEGFLVQGPEAV